MFPAEHRALRELHVTTRQLAGHWAKLGDRLGGAEGALLDEGATAARVLLDELEERVDELAGRPAAQSVGARLAGARGVSDLLLERNQAFRGALLDLQHVTTLLAYTAELARTRDAVALAAWQDGWGERLRVLEERARAAAVALGSDPVAAIAPAEESRVGRTGARVGVAFGTIGEAIDNSPLGRLARGRAT
jgi:hypothetical protein